MIHLQHGYERWGCFQREEVEEGLRAVWVQKDTLTQLNIVLSDGDVFKASVQEPQGYKRTLTFTGLLTKKKVLDFVVGE